MTHWTFTPTQPGAARNMAAWQIARKKDEPYQIDVSWPLTWSESGDASGERANAVYLVDGNALFLTATEALRRRKSHRPSETGTVVIAIGYPIADSVFSPRRSYDLTPPCDHYIPPEGPDGSPKPEAHGGADGFFTFITEIVRPFVELKVFPRVSFGRSALFGHSYGGLFALHALFTKPSSFDVYLAASPSIWWNHRFILREARRFMGDTALFPSVHPVLRLSFGSREQYPVRERGESDEAFKRRQRAAEQRRMTDNCEELYSELLASERLRELEVKQYIDEDHGSVIAPALSGGLMFLSNLNI
ncbi:alpha/beta hydrolase [Aspergillus foveolatus]|uniref:alpha/beta hydrolase n=1 Tax=Aspergillus foveolatus TaxID=210207 RepID=UPI003CCD6283